MRRIRYKEKWSFFSHAEIFANLVFFIYLFFSLIPACCFSLFIRNLSRNIIREWYSVYLLFSGCRCLHFYINVFRSYICMFWIRAWYYAHVIFSNDELTGKCWIFFLRYKITKKHWNKTKIRECEKQHLHSTVVIVNLWRMKK